MKGGRQTPNETNPTKSSFQCSPRGNCPEFSPIHGVEGGLGGKKLVDLRKEEESSHTCKKLFSIIPQKKVPYINYLCYVINQEIFKMLKIFIHQ